MPTDHQELELASICRPPGTPRPSRRHGSLTRQGPASRAGPAAPQLADGGRGSALTVPGINANNRSATYMANLLMPGTVHGHWQASVMRGGEMNEINSGPAAAKDVYKSFCYWICFTHNQNAPHRRVHRRLGCLRQRLCLHPGSGMSAQKFLLCSL